MDKRFSCIRKIFAVLIIGPTQLSTGDNVQASGGRKRPKSASTTAHVPSGETQIYLACFQAVAAAKADRTDPTSGAIHFNLRGNNNQGPLFGVYPIRTHDGPFSNGYTKGGLPAKGVYVNTYK